MKLFRNITLVALATAGCGQIAHAQAQFKVDAVVAEAVAKRLAADDELKSFTYVEDRRWSFVTRNGRTPERHETYEYTHVAQDQYLKKLEENGKELKGSDLKHEEKRYGQALERNKGFDLPQRAEHGEKYVSVNDSLDAVPQKYLHTFVRSVTVNGVPAWVVQCEPRSRSGETRTFTLWIDPVGKNILRYSFAVHEQSGDILDGSFGTEDFSDEHGVMLPVRVQHHLRMLAGGSEVVESDNEHVYRNYKRFQSTTRILRPDELAPQNKTGDAPR